MSLNATVKAASELTEEEVRAWKAFMVCREAFGSPFYSPHYVQAVDRVRPGVRVCVIRAGGDTVAFFPFQFSGTTARLLGAAHPVGDHMTDYPGVVAAPGFSITSRRLLALCGLNRFHVSNLEQSQVDLGLSGAFIKKGWIIDFSNGPDAYWQELKERNKDFVRKLTQRRKRLTETYGPLEFAFGITYNPEEFERLIAFKRAQYRRMGVADPLEHRWAVDLLRLLASSSAEECTGVLSVLRAGDRWVASHFGLRNADLLHDWFPVYDRELMAFGPGVLLGAFLIDEGWRHGLRLIDTGCGDYHDKRNIGTHYNTYYAGVWYRNAGSSVVLGGLASARRSLRSVRAAVPRVANLLNEAHGRRRMPDVG